MKISIPFVYVLSVENSKEKNCKFVNISLGKDKGFAKIVWSVQNKTFDYFTKIKKGDAIWIPSGELQLSAYYSEKTDKAYANLTIFTDYIGHCNWAKEKKEDSKSCPKRKSSCVILSQANRWPPEKES